MKQSDPSNHSNLRSMSEADVVPALAALAHAQRLRVFRALVVAGDVGLTPGVMAEGLAVARNALSFHLKELQHAGLVTTEQRGRNLIYRAAYDRVDGLIAYLTENCCAGETCAVAAESAVAC